MNYTNEEAIAKIAEQKLTSALKSKTNSFASHYHKKEGEKSIKDAFATAYKDVYTKDGKKKVFMRRLVINMERHGFIQHYGVDTIRAGGTRQRTKPKSIEYLYDAHDFKMKATPFITEAIQQSKVIDFVAENVAKSRAKNFGEELVFGLSKFTE